MTKHNRWSTSALLGGNDLGVVTRRRSGTDPTGYAVLGSSFAEEDYYAWRGTGWRDGEVLDSDDDQTVRGPSTVKGFGGKKKVHRFTAAEEQKMQKFESIDYWGPNNRLYRESLEQMKRKGRGTKWLVYALIGVLVGMCSIVLMNTISFLTSKRRHLLESQLEGWETTTDKWTAFSAWLALSFGLVAMSTGLCGLWPEAAGSGVPDVMAYLNGITFPKVFNFRTLLGKIVSCSFAVASGLPVGPEGPMIHVGSLVGAGIGEGRSHALGRHLQFFSKYRNARDHRDFITGGAAAGVACAFSAPIGGLLFVAEEMSSVFNKKAMWMAFFASLMAIITVNMFNSKIEGFSPRDGLDTTCTESFSWNQHYNILFKATHIQDVNLISIPFTLVLGAVTGFFGASFTFFNLKITRFRMHRINKQTSRRMLEPIVILLLFCTIQYALVCSLPCVDKPADGHFTLNDDTNGTGDLKYFDAICDDSSRQYHPLGTLVFASSDDVVRLLFLRGTPGERTKGDPLEGTRLFEYDTLAIWLFLYMTFACWSAGTYLACGLVIPMLIMGATIGRLYGLAIVDLFEGLWGEACGGVDNWVDPGIFAMLGAAGFFAGVSRLTFSLCVIMLEITGDLPHLPDIMLCVMTAKTIADCFTHPLYHSTLDLKCVPFLDWDIHLQYMDCYTAKHLIQANPKTLSVLHTRETIENIYKAMSETAHNAFPVVSTTSIEGGVDGYGVLKGTVLRTQLEQILWFLYRREKDPLARDQKLDYEGLVQVQEQIYWEDLSGIPFKDGLPDDLNDKFIDLGPLMNTSAFSVPETMSVSATYNLFRGMGLRHLVVVNKSFSVVGMLTRKDLVAHTILKNTVESDGPQQEDDFDIIQTGPVPGYCGPWVGNDGSGSAGYRGSYGPGLASYGGRSSFGPAAAAERVGSMKSGRVSPQRTSSHQSLPIYKDHDNRDRPRRGDRTPSFGNSPVTPPASSVQGLLEPDDEDFAFTLNQDPAGLDQTKPQRPTRSF
ncbi:Chloride channel protein D [Diplonema papillatum]|nr:Chloride channel protein D [Diplonema papillatum]